MLLDDRLHSRSGRESGAVVRGRACTVRERADDLHGPMSTDVGQPEQALARPEVHLERDLFGDLGEEATVDAPRPSAGRSCTV
jgi:hypothetical protein